MLYSTSVIGLALARPNALLARQLGVTHLLMAHGRRRQHTWGWRLTKTITTLRRHNS